MGLPLRHGTNNQSAVSVEHLPEGVYYMTLSGKGVGSETLRFVVVH